MVTRSRRNATDKDGRVWDNEKFGTPRAHHQSPARTFSLLTSSDRPAFLMTDHQSVFGSNPNAVLGASWGQAPASHQQGNQANHWNQAASSGSNSLYDDGSDDSFDDDDDEDDDYAPLQMTSWGTQTTDKEGTTQINIGWDSLIDPNIKIKPGGIGSGNLHRRGANYKPVDEEYILNQRLNKQSIPGSGKKKKKGKKSKGPGAPTPPRSAPPSTKASRPPPTQPRSTFQSRPPPQGAGAWGSGQLVDKPFWEMQAPSKPEFTPPANDWQAPSAGSLASKYAPKPSAASAPAPAPAPGAPQPVQPQPPQQWQQWQQQQQQPQQQPQQQWQQYSADTSSSLQSKWATASAPTTPPSSSSQAVPPPPAASGSAASKYAPSSAASKYAPQNLGGSADSIYAPPKPTTAPATAPAPAPPKERKLLFKFMIELVPGISAPLPVYDTSNYLELVDEFAQNHNLHIQDQARHAFASKIAALVDQQMQRRAAAASSSSPQQHQ